MDKRKKKALLFHGNITKQRFLYPFPDYTKEQPSVPSLTRLCSTISQLQNSLGLARVPTTLLV